MAIAIVATAEKHIAGLNVGLGRVAAERRYVSFLEAPSLEDSVTFVRNNIERGYPQFVAIDGEVVVGWCDVVPMPQTVFAHRGILGMGVVPEFRRMGVGRRLIKQTLAAARQFGLERVELQVRGDNSAAISLYKMVGFCVDGVKTRAWHIDGLYFDVVSMGLQFETAA